MRRRGMRLSLGVATLLVLALALSCGRTGLLLDEEGTTIGGEPPSDGSTVTGDGGETLFEDSGPLLDALPPIDVVVPPDAPSVPPICADAASTFIYLVSAQNDLFSYDPAAGFFNRIANIHCPAVGGPAVAQFCSGSTPYPFSMAVDQAGLAYVVYCDGELFTVNTADGHCEATGFASGQDGFAQNFGMGFTENAQGTGETLYVSADEGPNGGSILGSIDTTNFGLSVVGPFVPAIPAPELTGTAMGSLYAFYAIGSQSGIAQIDPATARIIGNTPLPQVDQGSAWAFAFWGGDFYTFTSPTGSGTLIQRYRPSDGTTTSVMTISDQIVGAGVSTCAPLQ